jgi:outer membrane protein OmpA-like peptidoglycan-associated protein
MKLLVLFFLSLPGIAFSQNLVANGDFEEENICAEFKVNCAPEAWIYTVPSFFYYPKGVDLAHSGSRCLALIAGNTEKPLHRTFVRSQLICALQKGKVYHLQLYAKSVHKLFDSLGVYFSSYDFLFEKQVYHKIVPSLYFILSIEKLNNTDTGWQKASFKYIATGNEIFITLGNFSRNGKAGNTGIDGEKNFFFLLDDVSLMPDDVNERLCTDWQASKKKIYDQDERHEFLERYIKHNRATPPRTPKPSPTLTVRVDTMTIPDVFFATNNFMINQKAASLLDSFAKVLNRYTPDSIVVYGHTDNAGSESYNKELSWRRAGSVAAYLEKKLSYKIESRGMGSEKPVATNLTAAGRRRNRRVEIYVFLKP